MQIGMIGLGRMGANMVRRLLRDGHDCVVHNRSPQPVEALVAEGATGSSSLEDLVSKLSKPRTVWIMMPAGDVTEDTIHRLAPLLEAGDIIVDGGNTYFKDDVRRAATLKDVGIHYVDAGTSGGVWGLERGYCLMVGGPTEAVVHLEAALRSLAPGRGDIESTPGREAHAPSAEQGYLHCGPAGAGHFVKMVHNGIEYGVMQAYAEGFEILRGAHSEALPEEIRYDLALPDIAELWRRGSVIGSWLLDLTARALAKEPELEGYSGHVADSGEGRWTVLAAIEEAVPADVLTTALYKRFRSRQEASYADKLLSAMREQFGGHLEKRGSQSEKSH